HHRAMAARPSEQAPFSLQNFLQNLQDTILIYLIYGPTCSGKTDAAIQIARETGWPVIALDRVQCCPQIATGSGRPSDSKLQSTQRIYLDSRPLTAGIIDAETAHRKLIMQVDERSSQPGLILEGGSISLLNLMARSQHWDGAFRWHVRRLRLGNSDAFLERAKRRVTDMFVTREGQPSLLQELADQWKEDAVRPTLEDVDGYRCAIHFAREHSLAISEMPCLRKELQQDLVEAIAREYLEYARWQERDFPEWQTE
ncbi:isopentenyl transferase family protein, partial [Mesorhizobium sp. M0166]|uniref:isopentenyl transferase family protein n=2 Tax=unclassified Mesorhizobium TaxID=325217 RepID=UPI00333D7F59